MHDFFAIHHSTICPSLRTVGAYAELFDLSCIAQTPGPMFDNIQDMAIEAWSNAPSSVSASTLAQSLSGGFAKTVMGEHYFVSNNGTLSPKWDMTSHEFKGNSNAYILAAKKGSMAASNPADVPWLFLTKINGSLADMVYRTDTRLGQPPSSVGYLTLSRCNFSWVLKCFAVHSW
jgi:hypothetical protein